MTVEIQDGMSAEDVRALVKQTREQTMEKVLIVGRRKAQQHRWCDVYDQDIVPALKEILVTKRTIEVDFTVTDTLRLTVREDLIEGKNEEEIRAWLIERTDLDGIDASFGDHREVEVEDSSGEPTIEATALREHVAPLANEHGAPSGFAARATSDGRVLHFIPRDIAEGGGYAYSMCERAGTLSWYEARNAPRLSQPATVCKACQAKAARL